MALFKTAPLEIFDEPMPGGTFPDPEIVGHFSVEGNGEIAFDESKKKFLVMPGNLKKVKFDLNEGYEDIAEIPEHQLNNIDYILRWIQEDRETHFPSSDFKNAFVGRRQLLTKVMCSPYDRDPWKFGVIFRDDNYYMCALDREKTDTPNPRDETWVRSIFWGWKMLQYLTSEEADGKPNPDRQCNQREEFDVVSKLKVNDHVLAYYYGMDAYDKDADCYVDIKTCKHVPEHDERKLRIFQRHKLLKWWAQSQLGAVSDVIGCYRDDSGIVTQLKRMPTKDMPDSAREWSAEVCYNFLDQFLTWVKERIPAVEDDKLVHMFEFLPQQKVVRYSQTRDEKRMFLPNCLSRNISHFCGRMSVLYSLKDGKPNPDRQCNQREEFDVVSKLKVNDHVLAYYYGMDAYDKDADCYVDIKTCKHVPEHDERKLRIFQRHKLLKWWAQSQLGAVSDVIGCYRDDSGIVTQLKRMPTKDMPDSAREWSAEVCFNFLDQFLTWVKERIPAVEDDKLVHMFEFLPQQKVVRYSQTRDEKRMFLPNWYAASQ